MSKSVIEWGSLLLLLIMYVAIALAHAILAPLTTGPDELAHYEYVNFIAREGRLPLNTAEREQASYKSDQPPLYHLIAALPASLVDVDGPPRLKRVSDHPRRQLIERTRHAWGLYNTEDEQWPFRGEVLRWQVGRWVAIFFGLLTVIVTYAVARDVFSQRWLFALAAAATVAFIPRFTLTGSMLNYETTVALLATLFLWVLLRLAHRLVRPPARPADGGRSISIMSFLLGLLAGLAIITKLSAVILPLEIFIAFWLVGRYQGLGWRRSGRYLLPAAAGTLLPLVFWFGFVIAQFNTVAQDGIWTGVLRPLIAADASDATTNRLLSFLTGGQAGFAGAIENLETGPPWEWVSEFFRTFWSVGIEQQQPLGSIGWLLALGLVIAATAGLILLWRFSNQESIPETVGEPYHIQLLLPPRLLILLLVLHLFLPLILPVMRYIATFSLADTAQGRHVLFLATAAFAILLVLGLRIQTTAFFARLKPGSLGQRPQEMVVFLPGVFLFVWSLNQLWTMTWAYLPPLPVTTQSQKTQSQLLNHPINDELALQGYNVRIDAKERLVRLDLQWQATGVSSTDYLTYVELRDAAGETVSEWLGYPADGRYPTRAWDPGDIVRDTVWLPTTGLDAGEYSLWVDLKPTSREFAEQVAAPLRLGSITLPESTLILLEDSFSFSGAAVGVAGYTVWQNGRVVNDSQPVRYRETISVLLAPLPAGWERSVRLVTEQPEGEILSFEPAVLSDKQALFIVGPDWPTGNYHMQAIITSDGEALQTSNTPVLVTVFDRWQRRFDEPFMDHRLDANFADQLRLLGYNLASNRAAPGGAIPLTLFWQGLDWMGADYTIFAKLVEVDDQSVHGGRDRLPLEGYHTLYWAPGEIITDPFGLPVEAGAPDGIYFINLGLYKEVGGQAISLPLVQDEQVTDVTSIDIGPIKIGQTPQEFIIESASPQVVLNQNFGDPPVMTLLGFDLVDDANLPLSGGKLDNSESLKLVLYWQPGKDLSIDYTTFVHVRSEAGETVAQKDQPPLGGAYPTSLWDPGETIADEIILPLPADLPAGTYQLVTGLYDFDTFQRLPVPGNPANEATLTDVVQP